MSTELIEKLLERIYFYYPIGIPSLNNTFHGRKRIKELIERKINQIISKEETSWTSFVKNLESIYGTKVFDMGYLQFPSYISAIELCEQKTELFHFTEKVIINISLLCPFYTIFYEDRFLFSHEGTGFDRPIFRIIFSENNKNSISPSIDLNGVKKLIEMSYPNYSFINHKVLFDYKINGLPYSHEDALISNPFPLYSFLFDPFLILDKLQIL